MKSQIRIFVAIELPDVVKKEVERIIRVLKKADLFDGRYVASEQEHITVKFIGSVAADQLDTIHETLSHISFSPCRAQLGQLDMFCAGEKIKIIYLTVVAPALQNLVTQLHEALRDWCEPETRDFISHVTIARVKRVEDRQRLQDVVYGIQVEPIAFTIDSFVLKQSVLQPEGAEYTTLYTYL